MKAKNNSVVKREQINNIVDALKTEFNNKIAQAKEEVMKSVYQKGDYYLTENSAVTVSTLASKYGGTWVKLADNIVLMSSSSDNTSKTNKFTISEGQMPKHNHSGTTGNAKGTTTGQAGCDSGKGFMYNGSGCSGVFSAGDGKADYVTTAWGNSCNLKIDISNHQHDFTTSEKGNNESIDLTSIIKRPKLFIFRKTSN